MNPTRTNTRESTKMAYKNPNTQAAIEAFAKDNNIDLGVAKARMNNYENIHCFEKGEYYEDKWATNLLEKGSKVVLINNMHRSKSIVEVVGVGKATVKVNIGNRDVTFNQDGKERGSNSSYALQIVQYVEGLFEIIVAEEKAAKEAHEAMVVRNNRIKNKTRAISSNLHRELTPDQADRLASLFDQFDAEDEAAKQNAA